MSSPFVAEIRIWACNFAPRGWAMCNGQLMPLSQNTALFSLLGTTYGGDGKSTFALPNMQGCVPVQQGQGPGLSLYDLGESDGSETHVLLSTEIPIHSHMLTADTSFASTADPTNAIYMRGQWNAPPNSGNVPTYTAQAPNTMIGTSNPNGLGIGTAGGSLPHNNLMPYMTLNFCIALQGVFPPRS